jgi:hypothetical protein
MKPYGTYVSAASEHATPAAGETLHRITSPSDAVIEIVRFELWAANDETSQMLEIEILTGQSTDGTMTSVTPQPTQTGMPAAGTTSGTNATAEPTGGTVRDRFAFNVIAGYIWVPGRDEEAWILSPSSRWALRTGTEALGAGNIITRVVFNEYGG